MPRRSSNSRMELWRSHRELASIKFAKGWDDAGWLHLLLAEELFCDVKEPSEKQKAQRKLSWALYRLEGMHKQLSLLYGEFTQLQWHKEAVSMARANGHVGQTMDDVRAMMKFVRSGGKIV